MTDETLPIATLPFPATSTTALVLDDQSLDRMMRLADIMASGRCTLPKEYRGSPGDCLAVVMQAMQWRMNPYLVAGKTHFVNGVIGYEAQLVNAVVVESGAIEGGFDYEWYGPWERVLGKFEEKSRVKDGETIKYRIPGWTLQDEAGIGIRVTATRRADHATKTLDLLLAQTRTRNSTLWADDPRQQLAYLGVKRWARLYTPGVMLGVYTPDELQEQAGERFMGAADVVPEPETSRSQKLKERMRPLGRPPFANCRTAAPTKAKEASETPPLVLSNDVDSATYLADFSARLAEAKSAADLEEIGRLITPDIKEQMLAEHVKELRGRYQVRERELMGSE